jgi:hypothetical protein
VGETGYGIIRRFMEIFKNNPHAARPSHAVSGKRARGLGGARRSGKGTVEKGETPPEPAYRFRQARPRAAPNGAPAKAD